MFSKGEPYVVWSASVGHKPLPNVNPFKHQGTFSDYITKVNQKMKILGVEPPPILAAILGPVKFESNQPLEEFCRGGWQAFVVTCEALSILQRGIYAAETAKKTSQSPIPSDQDDGALDVNNSHTACDKDHKSDDDSETGSSGDKVIIDEAYLKLIDSLKISSKTVVKPDDSKNIPSLSLLHSSLTQLQETFADKLFARLGSLVNGDQKFHFPSPLPLNDILLTTKAVRFVVHSNEVINSIDQLVPQQNSKPQKIVIVKSPEDSGGLICAMDEQFGHIGYTYEVSGEFLKQFMEEKKNRVGTDNNNGDVFGHLTFPSPNFKDRSSHFGTFLIDVELAIPMLNSKSQETTTAAAEPLTISDLMPSPQSHTNWKMNLRFGRKVNYDNKQRWANDWFICDINDLVGDGGSFDDGLAGSSFAFLLNNEKEEHPGIFKPPVKEFRYKK